MGKNERSFLKNSDCKTILNITQKLLQIKQILRNMK